MRRLGSISLVALTFGVASLFLEQADLQSAWAALFTNIIDYTVLVLTLGEVVVQIATAPVKRNYLKQNWPSLLFVVAFTVLFAYNKVSAVEGASSAGYLTVLIVRNLFLLLKVFTRLRKLSSFITSVVTHPAQTIALSFVLVIAVGTLLLMMSFSTRDGLGLPFVSSLFTTTSAVCVTGLIVVDTATVYTVVGQVTILLLIQIGGLGIMILSFFTIFVFRQSVSVENKLLISYMLSERNMGELANALRRIIAITVAIELIGALLLYPAMARETGAIGHGIFFALFHAVSAFCNAGFALFSDSLERFVGSPSVSFVISFLIIAGGLSFAVISNLLAMSRSALSRGPMTRRNAIGVRRVTLTVNSRVVLLVSAILIGTGMLLFYAFEHANSMRSEATAIQYLAAFFQSVTLRTAGFNTIGMGGFTTATYLLMMGFMFIGGASGSTAGGIKLNTVAVIGAYFSRLRRGARQTTIFRHAIPESQVASAFTVLMMGIVAVGVGTTILAATEVFSLTEVMFETVSAFATVGLSTGITSGLSVPGRMVIIVLMFIGRVGPLTLFSAFSARASGARVAYPAADISVG